MSLMKIWKSSDNLQMFKIGEGKRAQVVLLDQRKLDIVVQPKLMVEDLLDIVASHLNVKDPDKLLFGLIYSDSKDRFHWLQPRKRVLDHEFSGKSYISDATLHLYHVVKFYVDSIAHLQHAVTAELFFLQAKSNLCNNVIPCDKANLVKLAAHALQAYYGDFVDEDTTVMCLNRSPSLAARLLQDDPSWMNQVIDAHKTLISMTKGEAIVCYMNLVQSLPAYGVHFFEVIDKSGHSWRLGISRKGIFQYDYPKVSERPRRVFPWRQMENLYYRDRKFSIEFRDNRRSKKSTAPTSSVISLDEECQHPSLLHDYSIAEVTSNSVHSQDPVLSTGTCRRGIGQQHIRIHSFYAGSSVACRSIWSMAISQHQFYLDSRDSAAGSIYTHEKLASVLDRGLFSLIPSKKSPAHLSASDSIGSVQSITSSASAGVLEKVLDVHAKEIEYLRCLNERRKHIRERLSQKERELRCLCMREGEITGVVPSEINLVLSKNETFPIVKLRVGTKYLLPFESIQRTSRVDQITQLELDLQIQRKITEAALNVSVESSPGRLTTRKRRGQYLNAEQKLRAMEKRLHQLKLGASKPDMSCCEDKPHIASVSSGISISTTYSPDSKKDNICTTKSLPTSPNGSSDNLSTLSIDSEPAELSTNYQQPSCRSSFGLPNSHVSSSGRPPLPPSALKRPPSEEGQILPIVSEFSAINDAPIGAKPSNSVNLSNFSSEPSSAQIDSRRFAQLISTPTKDSLKLLGECGFVPNLEPTPPTSHPQQQDSSPLCLNDSTTAVQSSPCCPIMRVQSESSLLPSVSGADLRAGENGMGQLLNSAPQQDLSSSRKNGSTMGTIRTACKYHVGIEEMDDNDVGFYNIPNQRTSWNYDSVDNLQAVLNSSCESLCSRESSPGFAIGNFLPSTPSSPGICYGAGRSPRFVPSPLTGGKRYDSALNHDLIQGQASSSSTTHPNTSSLDRKVLKLRHRQKLLEVQLKKSGMQNGALSDDCSTMCVPRLDRSPTRRMPPSSAMVTSPGSVTAGTVVFRSHPACQQVGDVGVLGALKQRVDPDDICLDAAAVARFEGMLSQPGCSSSNGIGGSRNMRGDATKEDGSSGGRCSIIREETYTSDAPLDETFLDLDETMEIESYEDASGLDDSAPHCAAALTKGGSRKAAFHPISPTITLKSHSNSLTRSIDHHEKATHVTAFANVNQTNFTLKNTSATKRNSGELAMRRNSEQQHHLHLLTGNSCLPLSKPSSQLITVGDVLHSPDTLNHPVTYPCSPVGETVNSNINLEINQGNTRAAQYSKYRSNSHSPRPGFGENGNSGNSTVV